MHRCGPVGGQRWRGAVRVPRQFTQPPGEVHGLRLHGHGSEPHHPLKGTGVLGDESHFLGTEALQPVRVQVVAGRRADEGRSVWKAVLQETRRGFSEQGPRHPQQTEGVVLPQEVGEGRRGDGVAGDHGGRHADARGEGRTGRVGLQVDPDAMAVLDVLQQEPGAGEGLLTGGADVARGLVPTTCRERRATTVKGGFRRSKNLIDKSVAKVDTILYQSQKYC